MEEILKKAKTKYNESVRRYKYNKELLDKYSVLENTQDLKEYNKAKDNVIRFKAEICILEEVFIKGTK